MSLLQTIAAHAQERGLSFLVAGGHAVVVHGHPRNTFDLDLIIRREDRPSWVELTRELGYSILHEGGSFLQFTPRSSELLPLDLMLVNAETFDKLMADGVPAPVGIGAAKVVSLGHLLALKCHALKHGRAGRSVKDLDDVIRLVQANRVDMNLPETRELFLKHGTEELYERVRRICSEGGER